MKPKLPLCFAVVLASGLFGNTARADTVTYDSVEWLTAMADQIAVYRAERIYGPHSVTDDAQHWGCCSCSADFKLMKTLRGTPPEAFSRTRTVEKPEQLGFHSGDTYIFFFVADERLKNIRENVQSTSEAFFSMWDYLWLERPTGDHNGVAIDHNGKVLSDREEILKLVESSLKLPRADPGIDRWAYFYGDSKALYPANTNFNFRVIHFPAAETVQTNESWVLRNTGLTGLVIPMCLARTNLPATNTPTQSFLNR